MSGKKFTFHEVHNERGDVLARFMHTSDADYFAQIKRQVNYWNEGQGDEEYTVVQVQRTRL